jgi:hypothetical protein
MSAKTYASFEYADPSTYVNMGNITLYCIVPLGSDDDPDLVYRSRLTAPWNGSGPWFVVRRGPDFENPSTDGLFGVALRSVRYSSDDQRYILAYYGYKTYIRITATKYGGVYYPKWRHEFYIKNFYSARSTSKRYYYVYGEYLGDSNVELGVDDPGPYGFSYKTVESIWKERSFKRAYSVLTRLASSYRELPYTTVREVDSAEGSMLSSYVKTIRTDLAPPQSVYAGIRDDAMMYLETGILPGTWARGLETAFIEAGKNLPQSATNVAANVLEAAEVIGSFLTGNFLGNIPRSAREAWLAYRYAYTTTKLDIRDFKSTFDRLEDLVHVPRVSTYGSYVRGGTEYRVGYDIDVAQIIPTDVSTTLRKFGLELNMLNVWDMIPFSFVADWFLPISDVIEYFQDMDACKYNPVDLWWSITTVIDGFQIYVRLPGRKLSTLPYLQLSSAGSRTIALRIADSIALFAP